MASFGLVLKTRRRNVSSSWLRPTSSLTSSATLTATSSLAMMASLKPKNAFCNPIIGQEWIKIFNFTYKNVINVSFENLPDRRLRSCRRCRSAPRRTSGSIVIFLGRLKRRNLPRNLFYAWPMHLQSTSNWWPSPTRRPSPSRRLSLIDGFVASGFRLRSSLTRAENSTTSSRKSFILSYGYIIKQRRRVILNVTAKLRCATKLSPSTSTRSSTALR